MGQQRSSGWVVHQVPTIDVPFQTNDQVLAEYEELFDRERKSGVRPGQWFLGRVGGRTDPSVRAFFISPEFRYKAVESQRCYCVDLKVFLEFLEAQGTSWRYATHNNLEDYEFWRRRDERNPDPVSGAKFNRELSAIRLFYDFQVRRGALAKSPVLLSRAFNPITGETFAPTLRSKRARKNRVKWLTPAAFRAWSRVGLGGYTSGGLPDSSWKGRNDGRNLAFAELLWSSGLRLREAGSLLTTEIPSLTSSRLHLRGRLSSATTKNGEPRDFWVSRHAVSLIEGYGISTRQLAVDRARDAGRYDGLPGMLLVTDVLRRGHLRYVNDAGVAKEASLDDLDASDRLRLFRNGPAGVEPVALWLNDAGLPMKHSSWEAVFAAANRRTQQQGLSTDAGRLSCRPHMLRHSFALRMLVTLFHRFDQRLDLTPEERKSFLYLYGDVWALVATLLGHKSPETTRSIYLRPVLGLQVDHLLNGDPEDSDDIRSLLAKIAAESGLVHDIPARPSSVVAKDEPRE